MMTIETNFEPYNLNDYVKVKLNDEGFAVWKLESEKHLPVEYHKPLEDYKTKADADGYVQFQAWVFIQLFGRYIYMAGPMLYDTTVLIQRPLPPLPPARRPLSSLTEEECAELYRLAFGNDYELENVTHHQDGSVKLWVYDRSELVINTNGVMCAVNTCYGNDALDFNAVAVVRFLDGLGIQLG